MDYKWFRQAIEIAFEEGGIPTNLLDGFTNEELFNIWGKMLNEQAW